ncbi:MAG: ferritin family protein [bacterium]
MPLKYTGPEVLEMAVETERGGKLFYEQVAAATRNEELRRTFRFLAEEELKHIAVFQDIANSLTERPEEMPYHWEEAIPYLDAIVDSRYFLGKDKALALVKSATTPREAVEHALGFEKETLLFYTELLNLVAERNKPAVARLIAEEKAHVVKLNHLLGTMD